MKTKFAGFLLLMLVFALGCGGGPTIVPVSGIATHKGQPVPSLMINFEPDNGRSSWGITDDSGKFILEYDAQTKGAVVGKHTVSAKYWPRTPEEEMGKVPKSEAVKEIEKNYSDQVKSPLKVEITRSSSSLELKFD